MKKLVAIVFCILCAGLIFARGKKDSSAASQNNEAAERLELVHGKEQAAVSVLGKYSDEQIERVLANACSISLPNGIIHTIDSENIFITAHEIEHQNQYRNGNAQEIYGQLFQAVLESEYDPANPYAQLSVFEREAMLVEDRAGKKQNQENKVP